MSADNREITSFREPWVKNKMGVWVALCAPHEKTDPTGLKTVRMGAPKVGLSSRTPLLEALLCEPSLEKLAQGGDFDPLVEYYSPKEPKELPYRSYHLVPCNGSGSNKDTNYLVVPIPRIAGVQRNWAGTLEFVYDEARPLQGIGVAMGSAWESPFFATTKPYTHFSSETLLQAAVLAEHGITVEGAIDMDRLSRRHETGGLSQSIYWAGLHLAQRVEEGEITPNDLNQTLHHVLSTSPYTIEGLTAKLGIDLTQYY